MDRRPAAKPVKGIDAAGEEPPTGGLRESRARLKRWPWVVLAALAVVFIGGYYGLTSLVAPRVELKVDQSPAAVEQRDKQVAEVKEKIEAAHKSVSQNPKVSVRVEMTNAEVNAYLAKAVGSAAQDGPVYPRAAQVDIKPEVVAGDVSLVVAGRPVGVHLDLKPEVGEGKVVLKVVDAAVGGIPLPTSLGPLAGAVRQSLPSGVTFDTTKSSFVIDPEKLPFDLKQLELEAGRMTATVGEH
ncbi:MAG TPA: hypothetical protein VGL40_02420 [Bacillota bacterium]|jgi:uncharacterized protein YpmS